MNWISRWSAQQLRMLGRSGPVRVLCLALIVAVGAGSSVQLFSDRVARAIAAQSGDALGADLMLSSRQPMSADTLAPFLELASDSSRILHLPSVVWHQDRHLLAGLKAVEDNYPLRGELRIADDPFGPERAVRGAPQPGQAWVDPRLWNELGLSAGATLEVGAAELQVAAVLRFEPDRGSGFVDIAPRLMLNAADLAATNLLQPGSRAQHRVLLRGNEAAVDAMRALPLPRGLKRQTPAEARPEIRSALDRAETFLGLAAMSATILGAAAIALCAQQYAGQLSQQVALMRTLGARRRQLSLALLQALLGLGLLGTLVGGALGWLTQFGLNGLSEALLLGSLPAPRLSALLPMSAMAFALLLGFALPPLLSALDTPPIRVFQRGGTTRAGTRLWLLLAAAGLIGTLWLQTGDLALLATILGGQVITLLCLAGLLWLTLRALRPLASRSLRGWRLGLNQLLNRRALTIAQGMALCLGLLALLLLTVVREDLLRNWRASLPADAPNQFLINIQPDQVEPLRGLLEERGIEAPRVWPMIRSRLTHINGAAVSVDDFDDPETQRWINRDFNLSFAAELGPDNHLIEGDWWGDAGAGLPWLSADSYARERLNLAVGDTLTLDVAGTPYTLTVHNFREVDWESFQPNFFLMTPPGVLDDAPATWLTSFFLPPGQNALLREIADRFPNVTLLDIGALMDQVRSIMDRIIGALELVFLFTLAAGLTVLLAALEAGRDQRSRDIALLRTLGCRRADVRLAVMAEFTSLGLVAGLIAGLAAQGVGWVLAEQIFEFDYRPNAAMVLASALGSALLVLALAWLRLRGITYTRPARVLN